MQCVIGYPRTEHGSLRCLPMCAFTPHTDILRTAAQKAMITHTHAHAHTYTICRWKARFPSSIQRLRRICRRRKSLVINLQLVMNKQNRHTTKISKELYKYYVFVPAVMTHPSTHWYDFWGSIKQPKQHYTNLLKQLKIN